MMKSARPSKRASRSRSRFESRPWRGTYLQEEAFALVEKGDTSVQEVLRILKGTPKPKAAGLPSARPTPTRAHARK